ncbi:hypothetical protein CEXT_440741 [Caerostris extrusa]|uniref:Uncharacterized protein n=1 Tax=Caerostris extrusa TaxID=172846 RepID=A0AAV4QY49_CAEEX|nr:hypothetical protein CEXT_440741 [Caerostris extrusa]
MIYGSAAKTTLDKLNTVHHQGLRLSSGAFRTLPVHSLYVINHEPSDSTMKILLPFINLDNPAILPLACEQSPWHNRKIQIIDDLEIFPRQTTLPSTYFQLFFVLIDAPSHTIKKSIATGLNPIILLHRRWCFKMR